MPHDVQPEEIDVAIGIDRMQQALDIPVRRVEHSWAGLRTFTPDGSLAFGWDPLCGGVFLVRGAGGYGIQTAPAAGRFVADLVLGRKTADARCTGGGNCPGAVREGEPTVMLLCRSWLDRLWRVRSRWRLRG